MRIPSRASSRKACASPRGRAPARAAGILLALLAAGCTSNSAVYRDTHSQAVRDRTIAVVDSAPLEPLSEARLSAILERVENRMRSLPHVRRLIARQEVAQLLAANPRVRNEYQQYADTLSVVSVSDRELARDIGQALGADLLLNVQAVLVPCSYCVDGDGAYMVGQIIDPATGKLLFRVDVRTHPQSGERGLADAFGEMEELLMTELTTVLTPKSHRDRFQNLMKFRDS